MCLKNSLQIKTTSYIIIFHCRMIRLFISKKKKVAEKAVYMIMQHYYGVEITTKPNA